MARSDIPNWKGWMKSHSTDLGGPSDFIVELRRQIGIELHATKKAWRPIMRRGILSQQTAAATYNLGPFELPIDSFASSRWHPRRTQLPVCLTREDWKIAWEFWRAAGSYQGIKTHIEEHGMRRPIIAEWFVNGDPAVKLAHGCFATLGETPAWPFLVARTGNERILMGMFEWGWTTIPTTIMIRDMGHDAFVSGLIRAVVDGCPREWKAGQGIIRGVNDETFRDDGAVWPPAPTEEETEKTRKRRKRRRHAR